MSIDRPGLAEFLRHRRESLQPEDVGLPRGYRRRTAGLRREEVAHLCHMSPDYYARLERERGPVPSTQLLASIAQGLHLSPDERDHLFRLGGHHPPARGASGDRVSHGLLRVLDCLPHTPAEIVTPLGETLRQNPLGVALTGDTTGFTGPARSSAYRWFTDAAARRRHLAEDHPFLSRVHASALRRIGALHGPRSRAAHLVDLLLAASDEFRAVWHDHEIGVSPHGSVRFVHPEVGLLELDRQTLHDPNRSHSLLVHTAVPGSESHEKLRLLSAARDAVVG